MTKGKIVRNQWTGMIDVTLTEGEIAEHAARAAELYNQLETMKEDAAEEARRRKDDMRPVDTDLKRHVRCHLSGKDTRVVDAERVFDFAAKKSWVEYLGVRYAVREMTDQEVAASKKPGVFGDHPELAVVKSEVNEVLREERRVTKKDHTT